MREALRSKKTTVPSVSAIRGGNHYQSNYPTNMGMDICSKKENAYLHYNWWCWGVLLDYLEKWGVGLAEFSGSNDGDTISAKTCQKVADAIKAHWHEIEPEHKEWLRGHSIKWQRNAKEGGAEQW